MKFYTSNDPLQATKVGGAIKRNMGRLVQVTFNFQGLGQRYPKQRRFKMNTKTGTVYVSIRYNGENYVYAVKGVQAGDLIRVTNP